MKVLVAEDDPNILAGVAEVLEGEGYSVIRCKDGLEALSAFSSYAPDFVFLDIMMPGASGYDVCRELRARDRETPIVFLSAKTEEIDKVLGLELGADDYIMKPFGVKELVARVRAIARRRYASRQPSKESEAFWLRDLEVLPHELRARRGGLSIELSLREVAILRVLAGERGRVVDRDHLFREAWGVEHYPNTRTLDQHISKLRRKIERDPRAPELILTVHGSGYRFDG